MIFKRAFIYFLKIFWGLRTKDLRGGWITGDPAHSKHLHTSDEDHAWVYENKSRAGHSINFQWEWRKNRFKHWPCWGLPLIFFFSPTLQKLLMGGASSSPFNSRAAFQFPFAANSFLRFSQFWAEQNLTQCWTLNS